MLIIILALWLETHSPTPLAAVSAANEKTIHATPATPNQHQKTHTTWQKIAIQPTRPIEPGSACETPWPNTRKTHQTNARAPKPALRGPPPPESTQTTETPDVYSRFELDSPVAPNNAASLAAEGAQTAVKFHKHHTVPLEILKILPDDVAKNPLVRGKAGAPNRWSIPEDLHKAIHKGPGGGLYNETFKQHLNELGRRPTVDDILDIRNDLVKQFGLEGYRP